MPSFRGTAKFIASSTVVACIAVFFYRAFKRNWATIQAQHIQLDYRFLGLALLCIVATYLVPTYGWRITLNSLSTTGKLSFTQSIAATNTSNLTKYIPGKIWTYALQMYWLAGAGFAKSLVVYVNVINLLISLLTSFVLGIALLLPFPDRFPLTLTLGSLVILLALDVATLKFHDAAFKWLIALHNKLFKRNLAYFQISTRLVVDLHVLHLVGNAAFGVAAYFVCLGIGYSVQLREAPLLMASLLLSDTIAVLAVIVPGGLGVREGIMYAMLGGAASGPLALTLPVATRIIHMIVDVGLGGTALRLLRNLQTGKDRVSGAVDVPPPEGRATDAKRP